MLTFVWWWIPHHTNLVVKKTKCISYAWVLLTIHCQIILKMVSDNLTMQCGFTIMLKTHSRLISSVKLLRSCSSICFYYLQDAVLMSGFVNYLTSFRGGHLSDDQANKHMTQAKYILASASTSLSQLDSVDKIANAIEAKLKDGKWQANTCKTYLQSLCLLVVYIKAMTTMGQLSSYDADILEILKNNITSWCRSLQKNAAIKKKDQRPSADRVNPQDLALYTMSDRAKDSEKILKTTTHSDRLMHTRVRNFLILKLAISNCHRTGCLKNMTLDQFVNAEKSIKRGSHIIEVQHHKTQSTHGNAEVIVDTDLYKLMNNYKQNFRPVSDSPYLFLTWTGAQLDSGNIINSLSRELVFVGVEKK